MKVNLELMYYLIIGNEPGFVMLAFASSMISADVLYWDT